MSSALWAGRSCRFRVLKPFEATADHSTPSDNDEFSSFLQQYGMQHVNRTDGSYTRSYKRSMFDYVDFFHEFVEE